MNESDSELLIEREFDAPRDLVFKMWSDPEHFRNWAAPTGFKVVHLELDFQVGGIYRVCLESPDGKEVWIKGRYKQIEAPDWFSLTTGWEQEDGSVAGETLLTVSFKVIGKAIGKGPGQRTLLTLRQGRFESTEGRDGSTVGWNETLDSLVDYLRSNEASYV